MTIKRMKPFLILITVIIMVSIAFAGSSLAGAYKDRDGKTHEWSVNGAHALVWDGAPYVPFGVVFEPAYLSSGQTDDNWSADEAVVEGLKLAGINDILLKPGKEFNSIPTEAFQKVIDLLESSELNYGVEISGSWPKPLTGYVVQPIVNRVEGIQGSTDVVHGFPDTKMALYVLCDAKTAVVRSFGHVPAPNGEVSVPVRIKGNSNNVLLFYPQKTIGFGNASWCIPDLWSDYDKYRDNIIQDLRQIKFGKGLRFFIDPLTDKFGIHGEMDAMIPSSDAFRLEYTAWLSRKYNTIQNVKFAWGISKHSAMSFAEVARYVPLWRNGRGVPAVYDPNTNSLYDIDTTKSNIWNDFQEFRSASVRGYLDSMADVINRTVADVPFVYTANDLNPVFQSDSQTGFSGLAVPAVKGTDSTVAAGRTLSLAEGSSRGTWMISRVNAVGTAFANREEFFGAINALRGLGSKGFFVNVSQGTALQDADFLVWYAEYSAVSAKDRLFASYKPKVVYYYEGSSQASLRRLPSGSWWLPKLASGIDLLMGSDIAGYVINGDKGYDSQLYVWSTKGPKLIHLAAANTIIITESSGDLIQAVPKKGQVEVQLDVEPMLIQGITPDQFLPIELLTANMQDLEKAIARADQRALDTDNYKRKLYDARKLMEKGQVAIASDMVKVTLDEILLRLKGLEIDVVPK